MRRSPLRSFGLVLVLASLPCLPSAQGGDELVSSFGEYSGYSEELFDEWVTTSQYVEMRDGVLLAVDVTRPAIDGVAVDGPFPVVWTHSRYHRNPGALSGNPGIQSFVDAMPALQRLVRHGYVVCAAGVRGSGASFGAFEGLFSENETLDAVELIEWFAKQPWCDGNVGMHGGSYLGITQYMAASKGPEALKAIVPEVAAFDMFDIVYPGGLFHDNLLAHWSRLTRMLDTTAKAPPVTDDPDGTMRDLAIEDHAYNWPVMEGYSSSAYRDVRSELMDWSTHGPSTRLAGVNEAQVPCYHLNGWLDVFALDTMLWFANYAGPQRVMMGDWSHSQATADRQRLNAVEQHRWFDRWLKGIENGVEDEPPIQYALMIEPGQTTWRSARTWPPEGTVERTLFLAAGPSGSVESVNDGLLATAPAEAAADSYAVDPTTTTGASTRWDNAVGAAPQALYPGLADNDRKCLTYTTPVLEQDLTVVGHPVVSLHVTSTSGDADLHVLLEEVGPDGDVRYVTEGILRASHREQHEAPYDNLGLPYQRIHSGDARPLDATEPAEVVLDLLPTATVFNAGNRLRLVVMGADADNTEESPVLAETTLGLHHGGAHPSALRLPVLED